VAAVASWPGLARLRHLGLAFNRINGKAVQRLLHADGLRSLLRVSLYEQEPRTGSLEPADVQPLRERLGVRLLL
jgi:hypothetical protein